MSNEPEFTDKELKNIARGFDAPAKPDHLEKLREQARQREKEMTHDQELEPEKERNSPLDELYRQKEKKCERGRGR